MTEISSFARHCHSFHARADGVVRVPRARVRAPRRPVRNVVVVVVVVVTTTATAAPRGGERRATTRARPSLVDADRRDNDRALAVDDADARRARVRPEQAAAVQRRRVLRPRRVEEAAAELRRDHGREGGGGEKAGGARGGGEPGRSGHDGQRAAVSRDGRGQAERQGRGQGRRDVRAVQSLSTRPGGVLQVQQRRDADLDVLAGVRIRRPGARARPTSFHPYPHPSRPRGRPRRRARRNPHRSNRIIEPTDQSSSLLPSARVDRTTSASRTSSRWAPTGCLEASRPHCTGCERAGSEGYSCPPTRGG